MKVFSITLICGLVSVVAAGSAAWPGALPVSFSAYNSAVLPAQTRSIAYSSSQYINGLPSFGYQPHLSYQLPQSHVFPSLAYQPISPYFPQSTFLYPQIPSIAPIAPAIPATPAFPAIPAIPASPAIPSIPAPQQPGETASSQPTQQPAGDEDSTVIDSADLSQPQQNFQQTPDMSPQSEVSAQSSAPSQPQFPSHVNFPPQLQFPFHSDFSSQFFPSQSQESENMPPQSQQPAFPQFPQVPQFPQLPQLPQFPSFPSNPLFPQPTTPPPSSPGADDDSKGLNDADSISVDSA